MTTIFRWHASPRKRSYWRGVLSGVLSHYIAVAVLVSTLMLLRPFVWPLLFDSPYSQTTAPIDPNSGEGTLLQILGLLSWVPAGASAMHWGSARSRRSVLTLFGYIAVLMVFALTQNQPQMSALRTVWYWLHEPLGLAFGVVLYTWQTKTAANARPNQAITPSSQSDA